MMATLLLIALLAAPKLAGPPIATCVKSVQTKDGFTDPDKGHADSVKNLLDRLKDDPLVRLVQKPEDAVILLELLSREKKASRSVMWGHKEEVTVAVQLTAGDFTAEFTGASNTNKGWGAVGNYGRAAGEVVKQLDSWIIGNEGKLREIASAKPQAQNR